MSKSNLFNCFKWSKKKESQINRKRKHSQRLNSAFVIELNDDLFRETLTNFDLSENQIEKMLNLPDDKKKSLLMLNRKNTSINLNEKSSDMFVQMLNDLKNEVKQVLSVDSIEENDKKLEELKLALRLRPMSFVTSFLNLNGFDVILECLNSLNPTLRKTNLHYTLIGCIKALLNNSKGISYILTHEDGINIVAQSLIQTNTKIRVLVLQILSALCYIEESYNTNKTNVGHVKVFNAMKHLKNYANERLRFQSLIDNLHENCATNESNLKIATLSFINALITKGFGEKSIEFRLHVRYELLMMGIQNLLDKLRGYNNVILDKHIDFFEKTRLEDELNYASLFSETHVNCNSASSLSDLISKRLVYSTSYSNWLSILNHLLLSTVKGEFDNKAFWILIETIVKQVVLSLSGGRDYLEQAFDYNDVINKTISQVKSSIHNEYETKLEAKQVEIRNLLKKLDINEVECNDLIKKNQELNLKLNEMTKKFEEEQDKSKQLSDKLAKLDEKLVSVQRDDVKSELKLLSDDKPMLKAMAKTSLEINLNFIKPPVPPPLPMKGFMNTPPSPKMNKKIPKCAIPMKCFNWNKISHSNLDLTIWKSANEEKLYDLIDLDDFQKTFSAYQKANVDQTDQQSGDVFIPSGTLIRNSKLIKKEFSVIDSRRARNCTILLSKLKMTNDQLAKLILDMDPHDELPKDMIEQLLKFVPSIEEETLLEENRMELNNMAKADRFLYEMSKIFRYKQKLESLYYKKKYTERYKEILSKLNAINECCSNLKSSKKIHKFLEIVLALGNFMNQSHRKGVACGFSVSNLNKLIDIKSCNDKSYSMLHFILSTIQEKFPELMSLNSELNGVSEVAKINLETLEQEWTMLESGFADLDKELNVHSQYILNLSQTDEFIRVIQSFKKSNATDIHLLREKFTQMKVNYDQLLVYFAEDSMKIKFEEFFSMWSTFLHTFNEVKAEIRTKRHNSVYYHVAQEERKNGTSSSAIEINTRMRPKSHPASPNSPLSPCTPTELNEGTEFDNLVNAIMSGQMLTKRDRRKAHYSTSTDNNTKVPVIINGQRERILSQD